MTTREQLATLLENEAHNAAAERLRSGEDAQAVMKSILHHRPRYRDDTSREAHAMFRAVANGEVAVEDAPVDADEADEIRDTLAAEGWSGDDLDAAVTLLGDMGVTHSYEIGPDERDILCERFPDPEDQVEQITPDEADEEFVGDDNSNIDVEAGADLRCYQAIEIDSVPVSDNRLKITGWDEEAGKGGETRWLSISPEELKAIRAILSDGKPPLIPASDQRRL